ncbi:hypothetical protein GQ53DRAFT_31651 [Thozetella sp. PMI_491]|nr:hypothetical protein GQ53DRAFT_31651 [Thozetella sp. PMI_491]
MDVTHGKGSTKWSGLWSHPMSLHATNRFTCRLRAAVATPNLEKLLLDFAVCDRRQTTRPPRIHRTPSSPRLKRPSFSREVLPRRGRQGQWGGLTPPEGSASPRGSVFFAGPLVAIIVRIHRGLRWIASDPSGLANLAPDWPNPEKDRYPPFEVKVDSCGVSTMLCLPCRLRLFAASVATTPVHESGGRRLLTQPLAQLWDSAS